MYVMNLKSQIKAKHMLELASFVWGGWGAVFSSCMDIKRGQTENEYRPCGFILFSSFWYMRCVIRENVQTRHQRKRKKTELVLVAM